MYKHGLMQLISYGKSDYDLCIKPNIGLKEDIKFSELCRNDNLDKIKQHHKNNKIVDYNPAFVAACIFQQINVLRWLFSMQNNININNDNDKVFGLCVDFKSYHTLSYLLNLQNNNISSETCNKEFKKACDYGYQELAVILLLSKKLSNDMYIYSFTNKYFLNNYFLLKALFDNMPKESLVDRVFYQSYRKFEKVIKKHLISDLWKIICSY